MAFSSGFSPHPRISYANACATGSASEAEYLEIGLRAVCDPDVVKASLSEALPDGLDVIQVVALDGGPPLADRLEASHWKIVLAGVPPELARSAADSFLAAGSVEVERMTKKGMRLFDARAAVVRLAVTVGRVDDAECAILDLVVRHGTPSVRPDDVLAGLREVAGLSPPAPPLQTRVAQGPLDLEHGTVGDPLGPDRDGSG